MVLSRYCKQRIVQLYFERKVSYGRLAKVLAAEGLKVLKKTIWTTISKYKAHGTLSPLPGSGRRFKLTPETLAMIEAQMQADDETTATQLVKMLNAAGYDVSRSTIIRARRRLGWTFHGSRYCQMIRTQNKEKTDHMGTRQRTQHFRYHRLDGRVNDSARESLDILV